MFLHKLDNEILDFSVISNCLDKFFNDIMNTLDNNQYVTFQFTYKLSDNTFRSLGYLNKINNNDLNSLKDKLLFSYENTFDSYDNGYMNEITHIYIRYRYLDMSKSDNKSLIVDIRNKFKVIPTQLFNKLSIPSIINSSEWGMIKNKTKLNDIITYEIVRKNHLFIIQEDKDNRLVRMYNKDYNLLTNFTDKFISKEYFIRIIKDTEYHFINNELVLNIKNKKDTKFIDKINIDTCVNENIITLDLETYSFTKDNEEILQVISCCIYDGTKKSRFYLYDYDSSDNLLRDAIKSLLIDKYNNYKVYIHNFSGFDGIFLLKILATMDNTKLIPIIKDNKMIALTLKFDNKNKIIFHDSMLLLPSSLDKLSKAFDVNNKKIVFPIRWMSNNTEFNPYYIGSVPNIKYFNGISIQDYNNYILDRDNIWDFKSELLDYNMLDCISLYEILIKFNELIFDKFSLNVFNYPTLPALAFGIYKAHFLNGHKIPKIGGKMYSDIKQAYTGGSTDMYIPYGENLYHYDINSLYPTSMFKFDMPIGNIKYFSGNIFKIMDNPFGFFNCKVKSPQYLDNPILQIRYNDKTISPLGTFTGWFFSEELFNSMKYGYKFEILEGYLFEKDNIFKDYVSVLHQMKQSSDKSSALYLISKLLLNSLYGKFGMTDNLPTHKIVNTNKLNQIIETKDKITTLELDDNLYLISYYDKNEDVLLNDNTDFDISIGVAAAITSYSRVLMTQFKNLSNNKIYYTDTDSAIMDKPLVDSLVGNHLGQMVLEKVYKEFIGLGPKIYGGLLNNGKEFTKVKGFKDHVTFEDLKSLLEENKSLELEHSKWFRFIDKSSISIKNQLYTLVPTANKRQLVYENGKLIGTKAIVLNDNIDNN